MPYVTLTLRIIRVDGAHDDLHAHFAPPHAEALSERMAAVGVTDTFALTLTVLSVRMSLSTWFLLCVTLIPDPYLTKGL